MKRIFIILFALIFCEAYAQNSHYSSDLIHSDYNLVKDTLKKKYIIAEYGLVFPKLNILEDGQTAGAFASPLKLPASGYRESSGILTSVGTGGLYWTSTVNVNNCYGRYLYLDSGYGLS